MFYLLPILQFRKTMFLTSWQVLCWSRESVGTGMLWSTEIPRITTGSPVILAIKSEVAASPYSLLNLMWSAQWGRLALHTPLLICLISLEVALRWWNFKPCYLLLGDFIAILTTTSLVAIAWLTKGKRPCYFSYSLDIINHESSWIWFYLTWMKAIL